jgi:hypothetical protein
MTELLVERFERCGWVEGFGVLRFAQDDSKNKQQQGQMKDKNRNNGNGKDNGNGRCRCGNRIPAG